jgi:ubiquinone biosynthesis protein UbiJ
MVGETTELREAEEAAGSLDGMDRSENARQTVRIPRIRLQGNKITIELVEILGRLDEKLADELAVV